MSHQRGISVMEPIKSTQNPDDENGKIVFRDLESLLQQCLDDSKLKIINSTVTNLLPKGENFASVLMKIDVIIRRSSNVETESLHLVAKTPSSAEKSLITWSTSLKKELFIYEQLFPMYREIEKEAGVEESDLINVLPKFVGCRLSLTGDDVIDENSALIMENLAVKHYYNVNRLLGLDVQHAKKALTALARYHALGIVMKQKRPSFTTIIIDQAMNIGIDFSQFDEGLANVYETIKQVPCLKRNWAIIELAFDRAKEGKSWKVVPTEPWATIIHGDFWTNNILFHKNDNGEVDDVKFVDFQFYLYHSPLKDLPNLLFCCLDAPTQTNHLDELLELYYHTFLEILHRMNYNTLPFTKKSFDDELKRQAISEFPFCVLYTKFGVTDHSGETKTNAELLNKVFLAKSSDAFMSKLMTLIELYERMKWF